MMMMAVVVVALMGGYGRCFDLEGMTACWPKSCRLDPSGAFESTSDPRSASSRLSRSFIRLFIWTRSLFFIRPCNFYFLNSVFCNIIPSKIYFWFRSRRNPLFVSARQSLLRAEMSLFSILPAVLCSTAWNFISHPPTARSPLPPFRPTIVTAGPWVRPTRSLMLLDDRLDRARMLGWFYWVSFKYYSDLMFNNVDLISSFPRWIMQRCHVRVNVFHASCRALAGFFGRVHSVLRWPVVCCNPGRDFPTFVLSLCIQNRISIVYCCCCCCCCWNYDLLQMIVIRVVNAANNVVAQLLFVVVVVVVVVV